MTEQEARDWCAARTSPSVMTRLEQFVAMLVEENERQNLISPATVAAIWSRHIVDSAQLAAYRPEHARSWVDIGSGPGLPGLVIAILSNVEVTLVEPRGRRVDFLCAAAAALELNNVTVVRAKAEAAVGSFDVISARAVANIPDILRMTRHLRHRRTRLILPRGRNGAIEVSELSPTIRRMFHVEQSLTDPTSVIAVADGVID